ncbi:OmpA family protein [uncultured Shewanella sp.]|uniref:OmpA family protein n=1 Tax=uncultured Shewanella sp. TaxID=173975 RepID=UPI0026110A59|nr:OmpA family protein [uncultured Shewanella sp.]
MKTKIILSTLLTFMISFSTFAQTELTPWYIGVGAGINDYKSQCDKNIISPCDDTSYGWELFTGYQLNQYIGIELGYRDLGKAYWTDNNGEVNDYGKINTKGVTLGVVAQYPLAERWNINTEVGAMGYNSKITNKWGNIYGDMNTGNHTDVTPYLGAGIGFNITDTIMLSAIYRHYQDLNAASNSRYDLENNYWGLKLSYRFSNQVKKQPANTAAAAKVDKITEEKLPLVDTPYKFDINAKFEHDSTVINEIAYQDIKRVADFMNVHPNSKVTISGHASHVGSAKYNLTLSTRRAEAVEALLVLKFDIDPARITSIGYGFSQPLIQGHSSIANEANRRIEAEVIIIDPTQ